MTNSSDAIKDEIKRIEHRLQEILIEKTALEQKLDEMKKYALAAESVSDVTSRILSPDEKIALFMSLFACRTDVFPRLWENKNKNTKGYSPACSNEWISGVCHKPKTKCLECSSRSFALFTNEVVKAHLEGKIVAGMYAIRKDDSCVFLTADFDGDGWQGDVIAYQKAAFDIGIHISVEVSRSGNGAHAWIFFSEPIQACLARQLGFIILSLSQKKHGNFNVSSYDRFFPNQDVLPDGGFGNLISLPLQKQMRNLGRTVFVDEAFLPYEDQWNYLQKVQKVSEEKVFSLCEMYRNDSLEFEQTSLAEDPASKPVQPDSYSEKVILQLNNGIIIDLKLLPPRIANSLFKLATFANPKFFELQNMRFSTWGTPRYICCAQKENNTLIMPRGLLEGILKILAESGAEAETVDCRPDFPMLSLSFKGELYDPQHIAVKEMLPHDFGILKAPPGAGKTVMACALIAARNVSTLVVVHRDQLVTQWQDQLTKLLGIHKKQIGVYGGTRRKLKGFVDIAMVQSLSRCDDVKDMLSGYGHIVIDECHHIPAVTFENILREVNAKYILGLSATPYRKDGLQKIMYMQCGPLRHSFETVTEGQLERTVYIKDYESKGHLLESRTLQLYEIWDRIVNDPERLELIARDIAAALSAGRFTLVLSDRKEHLSLLRKAIITQGNTAEERLYILTGDATKKERKLLLNAIRESIGAGVFPCILSTGSFIGEGFDLTECDTLFLTMPVSFKGRLIQYAGRLHRRHSSKNSIIIYDYVDTGNGLTISMFKKRISAYKEMGYDIKLPSNSTLNKVLPKKQSRK